MYMTVVVVVKFSLANFYFIGYKEQAFYFVKLLAQKTHKFP